jgi:hypothetical protein
MPPDMTSAEIQARCARAAAEQIWHALTYFAQPGNQPRASLAISNPKQSRCNQAAALFL